MSATSEVKNRNCREFPSGPGVRTWCFHCWGPGLIPGQGSKPCCAANKQTSTTTKPRNCIQEESKNQKSFQVQTAM